MKRILNVAIGGRSFIMDEDACDKLRDYLETFKDKARMGYYTDEVMDELEMRIAEIFTECLRNSRQDVVDMALVEKIIAQLGMPDGSEGGPDEGYTVHDRGEKREPWAGKRLFRDPDSRIIGGVCSGLAAYFDIDTLLVRVLAVFLLLCGSSGFWIYVILWIAMPVARTATDKCMMRGLPLTIANLRRFSNPK